MSTPYSSIYNVFLSKVNDYNLGNLTDTDMQSVMFYWMRSATTKFKQCRQDLTQRDDVNDNFTADLSDEEIEIIACLMAVEWITPKVLDDTVLKQKMSDKDFQIFSSANQLKTNKDVRDGFREEAKFLIKQYTYEGDLTQLKSGDNADNGEPLNAYSNQVQFDY